MNIKVGLSLEELPSIVCMDMDLTRSTNTVIKVNYNCCWVTPSIVYSGKIPILSVPDLVNRFHCFDHLQSRFWVWVENLVSVRSTVPSKRSFWLKFRRDQESSPTEVVEESIGNLQLKTFKSAICSTRKV